MSTTISPTSATSPQPPRRLDNSLVGRLNTEWDRLRTSPRTAAEVAGWAAQHEALAGCASLADIERTVVTGNRAHTDRVLLALLRLGQSGESLATRSVVQLMLGKAVKIAASRTGRAPRTELEETAITALFTVVATYPTERRPTKVAANIAMDTLHHTVTELDHQRHETPTDPHTMHPASDDAGGSAATSAPTACGHSGPADLELLTLLTWAVETGTITSAEATLIVDVYTPAPGQAGGADAAARHGLTWPTARQRCSRAIRRITQAVQADAL